MKTISEINAIMNTIPESWRTRWCGGEYGACACMGCVQIGNRIIMFKKTYHIPFMGDPEYIDESRIPIEIYDMYKLTQEEWLLWKKENGK